jgi:predicted dehydrogenase
MFQIIRISPEGKTMSEPIGRRRFLGQAAASGAALSAGLSAGASAASSNNRVIVGAMGMSRGRAVARGFAQLPNVRVKHVCDPDRKRAEQGAASVGDAAEKTPQALTDYRKVLEDDEVDAVIIATPDHWHAPMAIEAMRAGKHVYVEKPCSHNAREGELLVKAAREHDRAVQMGNQRRTWPKIVEAMQKLHEGVIGRVYYSRGWYANTRGSIGRGKKAEPPEHVDYELWQGPAPRRPFRDNYLHYNWHWFWHWGTGEIGNNGVHAIDLCRWGLGVHYPIRATSAGGRYRYNDDQQTPDTHITTFDFEDGKSIMWEGMSCNRTGIDHNGFGASFHGEGGSLVIVGDGYALYDENDKEVERDSGGRDDKDHFADFVDAIRSGNHRDLNSEIEGGHKSTLLCHLGNIAHRTGRTIQCAPSNGRVINDRDAKAHWGRRYAEGWEPKL